MRKESLDGDRIFLIHDFLAADDCKAFIARSENAGFDTASITTVAGPVIDREVRDNARLISDDAALADSLWQRVRAFVPQTLDGWQALGLNE